MEKIHKNKLLEFRYNLTSKWINRKQQFHSDSDKFY